MPSKETVADLFELGIAVEKAIEELYRRLEAKFAHHQEVADLWRKYATEEVGHAHWLERLRDALNPDQLSAPADPFVLKDAQKVLQFSVENRLKDVKNLEDAYQLLHELENSETNAIFEFLITNFSSDKETQLFLRSQLRDHIANLSLKFPTPFRSTARRQAVKVLE